VPRICPKVDGLGNTNTPKGCQILTNASVSISKTLLSTSYFFNPITPHLPLFFCYLFILTFVLGYLLQIFSFPS